MSCHAKIQAMQRVMLLFSSRLVGWCCFPPSTSQVTFSYSTPLHCTLIRSVVFEIGGIASKKEGERHHLQKDKAQAASPLVGGVGAAFFRLFPLWRSFLSCSTSHTYIYIIQFYFGFLKFSDKMNLMFHFNCASDPVFQ